MPLSAPVAPQIISPVGDRLKQPVPIPPPNKDGRAETLQALGVPYVDSAGLELQREAYWTFDASRALAWAKTRHTWHTANLVFPNSTQSGAKGRIEVSLPKPPFVLSRVLVTVDKLQGIYSLSPGVNNAVTGYCQVYFEANDQVVRDTVWDAVRYEHSGLGTSPEITHKLSFEPHVNGGFELLPQSPEALSLPRFFAVPTTIDRQDGEWQAYLEVGIGYTPATELTYIVTLGIHELPFDAPGQL